MKILVNLISFFNHDKNSTLIQGLAKKLAYDDNEVDFLIHTPSKKSFSSFDNLNVKFIEYRRGVNIQQSLKNTVLTLNTAQIDGVKIYDLIFNVTDFSTKMLFEILNLSILDLRRVISLCSQEFKMIVMLNSFTENCSPYDKISHLNLVCPVGIFRILVSGLRVIKNTDKSEMAFGFMAYRLNIPVIVR